MKELDHSRTGLERAIETASGMHHGLVGRGSKEKRPRINPTEIAFRVFSKLLKSEGVRLALYALLRRSEYRFISIFRFQDGKATSVVHVDREDLKIKQAGEVADTATYCSFVRDGNGAFVIVDALADPRTAEHPARAQIRSYCGIPLIGADGHLIGTLCHYDIEPRDPGHLDVELLLRAAKELVQPGIVPAYPAKSAALQ